MKTSKKPISLSRVVRSSRTWARDRAAVEGAIDAFSNLNLLQKECAVSHFLGGCSGALHWEGRLSRTKFVEVLNAAREFGLRNYPNKP